MTGKHEYCWTIEKFSTLTKKVGSRLYSPTFVIYVYGKLKTQWRLMMYPGGVTNEHAGQVGIYLVMERSNYSDVEVKFEIWITREPGEKTIACSVGTQFSLSHNGCQGAWHWGFPKFALYERLQNLTKSDQLKIFCDIKITSFKGTVLDIDVPIASCDRLWDMYIEQKLVDATIKVEDKEYGVHKVIMASKSPVFAAMFEVDMSEKASNIVKIEDFEPEVVKSFVEFCYRGWCDGFQNHAEELLKMAEKYDIKTLKTECEVFLIRNLKKDSAAHILTLAHKHNAAFLKESTLEFVTKNVTDIMDKDKEGWESLKETTSLTDAIIRKMSEKMSQIKTD